MPRSPEQVRSGRRALQSITLLAAASAGVALYIGARSGGADVTGSDCVLALGLVVGAWLMAATRATWGADRAGRVQSATAINALLLPAAILLAPALFLAVAVGSAAMHIRSHNDRPGFSGNAAIRVVGMCAAAATYFVLAGAADPEPGALRSVVALSAAGVALVVTEEVLVVYLVRAWFGLDAGDLPVWSWAGLLPEIPPVLVGALFCVLYPTPGTLLVVGLIGSSHHALREHAEGRSAPRDDKTGLLSLPAFQHLAGTELGRAQRTGHPVAMLLMDLDGLKKVNTAHGHLAGDQYIVAMARLLAAASRSYDLVARFGGDEFCVLLPDTALPEASSFAERVRASVAATRIPNLDTPMAVSIGVAAAEPTDDVVTLLASADAALRYAKAHDRNQVVVAPTRQRPSGKGTD